MKAVLVIAGLAAAGCVAGLPNAYDAGADGCAGDTPHGHGGGTGPLWVR